MSCPLCDSPGGDVVWRDDFCRIVQVDDTPDYPGFCRVVLNRHVAEMTDLVPQERSRLMMTVMKVEQALRNLMNPDKINLAALGNVVPHLHWHVIPRFTDDPHFPNPIWGTRLRDTTHAVPADFHAQLARAISQAMTP